MGFIVLEAILLGKLGLGLRRMALNIFSKIGVVHGGFSVFDLPGEGLILLTPGPIL